MTVIFQIGLLTVLMTAVAAESMKYNIQDVDELPYSKVATNKTCSLDTVLINPRTKVKLDRIISTNDFVGFFVVDTKWSRVNAAGSSRLSKMDTCKGGPGIKVPLRCKNTSPSQCGASPQSHSHDFCLQRMEIKFAQDGIRSNSYMRVQMIFYDSAKNKITIEMNPFKPSKEKANREHAEKNKVPFIDSPIPQEALDKSPTGLGIIGEFSNQHFIGDISWMEKALSQAKLVECGKEGTLIRHRTENYLTGPVLLDEKPYDLILELIT